MKKLLSFVIILSFSIAHAQDLYDLQQIRTLHITFTESNWDALLDSMKENDTDGALTGTLQVDGLTFDSVAFRYKGFSSFNSTNVKNPWNIDLNEHISNQNLYGYTSLKLANLFADPSAVREVLSCQIMQDYMDAPRANYVYVYVNGDPLGLYTSTESINKGFLRKHFGEDDHAFFKCDPSVITGSQVPLPSGCSLPSSGGSSTLQYVGNDSMCYQNSYEMKSVFGWSDLQSVIDTLEFSPSSIESIVDVDRSLWMLAFNNVFVNLDSYTGSSGHNYYLYRNSYGRFIPIVWDVNLSFGGYTQEMPGVTLNTAGLQQMDPLLHSNTSIRPLANILLSDLSYRKKYIAHMRTFVQQKVAGDYCGIQGAALQSLIDSAYQADDNAMYSYSQFQDNLSSTVFLFWIFFPSIGITELMDDRYTFLVNHPELQKTPPSISAVTATPQVNSGDTIWITANVSGSNQVELAYKNFRMQPFARMTMHDDGFHQDGGANDGVFGACIPPQLPGADVYYYVYAENTDAGMFEPEAAEYNTFHLKTAPVQMNPGELVINELMARNNTTVADPAGEYEDWVELYNNASAGIQLNGMSLTNDLSDPFKWTFGDSVIAGGSYLTVWMDEDGSQPGLHANFKLSAGGESLYLLNSDGSLVDSVTWTQQEADTSYGRYPNGAGGFVRMPPTFAAQNNLFLGLMTAGMEKNVLVYPNPAKDMLMIESVPQNTLVRLTDVNGKIHRMFYPEEKKTSVDVAGLSSGIYFLLIGEHATMIVVSR